MNPWLVLLAIALVAPLYVLIPVGFAMAAQYRRQKLVRCPLAGVDAAVMVGRAGLAEALGLRGLRRIETCSLWPRQPGCGQDCRCLPEEAMREAPPTA
jgi:hypothetical protein